MAIQIEDQDFNEVGENIKVAVKGDKLIIVVDTKKNIGLSSTGKMMGVASTAGFSMLPAGLKGNIYIGRKA